MGSGLWASGFGMGKIVRPEPFWFMSNDTFKDIEVVWALRDWKNLGSASSTQLLDEPGVPENGDQQR